jgi:lipid-binding SYLF domain-containing protein
MKYGVGLMLTLSTAMWCSADTNPDKQIHESAAVLNEVMGAKDRGIPEDLLSKAVCVGIVPDLKRAGFIVGAKYGKGVLTCRTANGSWSAPEIIRIEGGSVGFQIGAGETDVVFVVMNRRGMEKLMRDKFTVGGDASVMAGPVGRSAQAETDAMMHADILSYSRSRGVFAGIALDGATLRPDKDENRALYGRDVTPHQILMGRIPPPPAASPLYAELNHYPSGNTARYSR